MQTTGQTVSPQIIQVDSSGQIVTPSGQQVILQGVQGGQQLNTIHIQGQNGQLQQIQLVQASGHHNTTTNTPSGDTQQIIIQQPSAQGNIKSRLLGHCLL